MAVASWYRDADRERFVKEPPKSKTRSPFQRDRARVVHSGALRRLGAKTQVLGAGANDFVRTRLTHSLEVAQVGRDIGQELGCDPDVVDAACLSHDLGHPPFGHNGETVLNQLSNEIGGFEGNAQTLRLLTRLEPKVLGADGPVGLNLTRATLDAASKYPWERGKGPDPASRKFGVYSDDLPVFRWMRGGIDGTARCLEAQVMDLSDDIAYSVHDIEDAITTGALRLEKLQDPMERAAALYVVQDWYLPGHETEELDAALVRLEAMPVWLPGFNGTYRAFAALKDMTSQLIGRFTSAAVGATQRAHGFEPMSRYDGNVVVPRDTLIEISVLKGLAAAYVMTSEKQKPVYARQEEVLGELVQAMLASGDEHLDPMFAELWSAARDDATRTRVVIDQVASLTDVSAYKWHERLLSTSRRSIL